MQASPVHSMWSRIQMVLPVNNAQEIAAARVVLQELKNHYLSLIVSPIDPPIFEMYWEDHNTNRLIRDCISLITFDVKIPIGASDLDTEMEICQLIVEDEYLKMSRPQDFVWMSVHTVSQT